MLSAVCSLHLSVLRMRELYSYKSYNTSSRLKNLYDVHVCVALSMKNVSQMTYLCSLLVLCQTSKCAIS